MLNLSLFEAFALHNQLPLGADIPFSSSVVDDALSAGPKFVNAPPQPDQPGDLPERGRFPLDTIPSVLRDYAEQLADAQQLPVELPALCMIATVSGSLGKQWHAIDATPERKTRGNLLMVLALPPGAGKGVSNRIARPLQKLEEKRIRDWREIKYPSIASEIQALEAEIQQLKRTKKGETLDRNALRTKNEQLEAAKRLAAFSPALITGNATTSGLAAELSWVRDETVWAFSAEAGETVRILLGEFRKEGGDLDLWLSGYSGEAYKQVRSGFNGGNSVRLMDPCLSSLLMAQPSVLNELLKNKSARERGLLTRLLMVSIEAELPFDDGAERRVSPQIESLWEQLIEDILRLRFTLAEPRGLICPPEVVEVFRNFYNETTYQWGNGKYSDCRSELARWRENAIRLAVVLQIATNPDSRELTVKVARDAVRLFMWIGIGSLEALTNGRHEKLHERLTELEKVLRINAGSRLASDLLKRNGFQMREIRHLAAVFPDRIAIEDSTPHPCGGRPGKIVRLVPPVLPPPPPSRILPGSN